MSATIKEPPYDQRNETWMRNKWQLTDFRHPLTRCYGLESVPRNHWIGVTVGAWVRYRGDVWQVWSWHRQSGYVWLTDGAVFMEAPVQAREVLSQAQDAPLEGIA